MTLLLNAIPAQAAKTTLSQKTLELGVANSYDISRSLLVNKNSKAAYTYTSSNKKVASVSKKGVIKSVKTGTAKITVKQTLKKKTTKVGTLTVKVKNSKLYDGAEGITGWIINQPGYFRSVYNTNNAFCLMPEVIAYYNPKAVYTIYSGDESRISVDKKGYVKDTNGTGTVKITLKETYNKKTRTVGTFLVELKTPSLDDDSREQTIAIGESFNAGNFLNYCIGYAVLETSDSSKIPDIDEVNASLDDDTDDDSVLIPVDENGEWAGEYKGIGTGTRYLYYYMYDYTQQKYTTLLGVITVNVIVVSNASSLQVEFEEGATDYSYNPADGLTLNTLTCKSFDVLADPYNYSGEIEAVSSDESVVKTIFKKSTIFSSDYNKIGTLYLTALNPGTATITVKANGAQTSFKVTVNSQNYETFDYYFAYTYFEYDGHISENDITFTSSDESIATARLDESDDIRVSSTYPELKYLILRIDTGTSIPNGAESAPVTITAYCKGTEIYSITLNVSDI